MGPERVRSWCDIERAGDSSYHFGDEYPFQQLFTAVTQACGLNEKVAATGYKLPDLEICEAAPDEDEEDDQV
jgi:hypothetical protein